MIRSVTDENIVCESNHLTSFAILVSTRMVSIYNPIKHMIIYADDIYIIIYYTYVDIGFCSFHIPTVDCFNTQM